MKDEEDRIALVDLDGTVAVIDRRPVNERTETIDGLPFRALYTLDEFEE